MEERYTLPDLTKKYWALTEESKKALAQWARDSEIDPDRICVEKSLKYNPLTKTVSGYKFMLTKDNKAYTYCGKAVTVFFRQSVNTAPPELEYTN